MSITPSGEVTTIKGDTWGYADGVLDDASCIDIFGTALRRKGVGYAFETNDNRIRKIELE